MIETFTLASEASPKRVDIGASLVISTALAMTVSIAPLETESIHVGESENGSHEIYILAGRVENIEGIKPSFRHVTEGDFMAVEHESLTVKVSDNLQDNLLA